MSNIVYGGINIYGYDLGVLMLDSKFPRIVGDIGNAKTWDFPVLYKIVRGNTPKKVVMELSLNDIKPFLEAAKELESQGVKAITTSCGFLSLFQNELADAVDIPVFTSALLLVPMIYQMLRKDEKVGILTANSDTLTKEHLKAVGADNVPSVIIGLQEGETFTKFTVENWDQVDTDKCRQELIEKAAFMMDKYPEVGAVVLECTNMPPFTEDIKKVVNVPVFDIVSLTKLMVGSVLK